MKRLTAWSVLIGLLAWAHAHGAPPFADAARATEIIEAVMVNVTDSYARPDVFDLVKGEFVPKELRARGDDPSFTSVFEPGQRYVVFVYDHQFIKPATSFAVDEDGRCLCKSPTDAMAAWDFKAYFRDHDPESPAALRALLLANEWRLFSWVYSALPAGGYEIDFLPSGDVTNHNGTPETWTLPGRGQLVLRTPGTTDRDYRFDAENGVFIQPVSMGDATVLMVIGPAGYDFQGYLRDHPPTATADNGLLNAGVSLLADWIAASRDAALAEGAQTIPEEIRQQLAGYVPRPVLDAVRWRVGGGDLATLQQGMLRLHDSPAIALDSVIVFESEAAAADPKLWVHELMHTMQYRLWGVDGFAARYVEDYAAVEAEAVEYRWQWMKLTDRLPEP